MRSARGDRTDTEAFASLVANVAVSIGVVLTVAIIWLALAQLSRHGQWPPFATNPGPPSLGETGDFFGGWANSLALVWLIVVTLLQYLALRVQREELRISRQELRETREEIGK
jgi:hypothetical protein